jgi:Xaa-Pro aminopeptidase
MADGAFHEGAELLQAGLTERQAAVGFHGPLFAGRGNSSPERLGGFTYCMSGPNAAQAYGAYARSRPRRLQPGDLALVHCNSYADGFWTDITRTYCLGPPEPRVRDMYDAVFAAREAALLAIRPGARAADIDRAARAVLTDRGFGTAFKHPTGHGVGFGAISPEDRPRLHPKSDDVLEPGMVFNVEPAIYLDGFGGIRHCDLVAVTEDGAEVLTPFQGELDLLIRGPAVVSTC